MENLHLASPTPVPPIVLLVEDDVDTRELYHAALEFEGYWVVGAPQVDEALVCASELLPDIIVTDIGLRGAADGMVLAERLRGDPRTAGIPLLAVTGRGVEEFGEKARLFDGVLLKPVLPENLSDQIQKTLEQSRNLRRHVAALRETTPLVLEKAQQLVAKSREVADASAEHARSIRACPKCHSDLRWTERLEIRGVTFDYYHPCTRGCGLFCYNHSERRFLPLTD